MHPPTTTAAIIDHEIRVLQCRIQRLLQADGGMSSGVWEPSLGEWCLVPYHGLVVPKYFIKQVGGKYFFGVEMPSKIISIMQRSDRVDLSYLDAYAYTCSVTDIKSITTDGITGTAGRRMPQDEKDLLNTLADLFQ